MYWDILSNKLEMDHLNRRLDERVIIKSKLSMFKTKYMEPRFSDTRKEDNGAINLSMKKYQKDNFCYLRTIV